MNKTLSTTPSKYKLDSEQGYKIRTLYEAGYTITELAVEYQVVPVTIRNTILREGGEIRKFAAIEEVSCSPEDLPGKIWY